MHIDLDRAMAVLAAMEEKIPWNLTIAIAGKDYPVSRPTPQQRQALQNITAQTPPASMRTLICEMLKLPADGTIDDQLLAGAAMTILLSLAELSQHRQQILAKEIKAQIAATADDERRS